MSLFLIDKCPICNSSLLIKKLNSYSEYCCIESCYQFYDMHDLLKKVCFFETKSFSIKCVKKIGRNIEMTIYESDRFKNGINPFPIIKNVSIINFNWDNLEALDKRIKNLMVFS